MNRYIFNKPPQFGKIGKREYNKSWAHNPYIHNIDTPPIVNLKPLLDGRLGTNNHLLAIFIQLICGFSMDIDHYRIYYENKLGNHIIFYDRS